MKNKRIVIILSFIVLFVAILILCSNIFALKKVNIKLENNFSISTQTQSEICQNKVFKLNQNIFFINKSKIISTLEKEYPNLLINSIETIFPNTFVIHAEQRKEVYYVKQNSSTYISFDKTFKALNIYSQAPSLTQVVGVNADLASVGEFLDNSGSVNIAKELFSSMYLCYYTEPEFINLVNRIEISNNYLLVHTYFNASTATTLKLENPSRNLTKKVVYALSALNALDNTQRSHGTVLVQEDLNDYNNLLTSYIE